MKNPPKVLPGLPDTEWILLADALNSILLGGTRHRGLDVVCQCPASALPEALFHGVSDEETVKIMLDLEKRLSLGIARGELLFKGVETHGPGDRLSDPDARRAMVPTHYGLTTRGFDPEENRIISFSYLAGDRPDDQIANPGAHPDYIDVVVERRSFVEWRDREYPRLGERPPPLSQDGVRWLIERELLDHPDLRTVNDLETTLRAKGHRFKRSILRDLYREVTGNTTPGPKGPRHSRPSPA